MFERYSEFVGAFWASLGAAFAGATVYVFRRIFTNQAEIKELKMSLQAMEEARELRDKHREEKLDGLQKDVRDLRDDFRKDVDGLRQSIQALATRDR